MENYELASLLEASNSRPGVAAASPHPARLLEALQQLLKNDSQLLTEPQSFQLRALLEPLTLDSDATMLLPQLKNLIENSGVFFEAKLRTVLEAFDASPEEALQKVASDLKLLAQLQQRPSSSASATVGGESTQTLAANHSLDQPATTGQELELLTQVVSAKQPSQNLLTVASRESGVTEQHAVLQALLDLMKASPDAALQKLSSDAATLLQAAKPEQILTQATMNGLERLLKQAGVPAIPTAVSDTESQANHNQLAAQIPKAETSNSIAKSLPELDQTMLQLLEAVRSRPELESRKLLSELAALLTQTKEQDRPVLSETATLSQGKATVLEQAALLSNQVLSRQTEAAFEWLKNGAFQTELPLQFGAHSTQAKIRFFQETDKEAKGQSRRPLNINIYLDLPETGKLEAWARWEGSQIQATLYVRDAEARDLLNRNCWNYRGISARRVSPLRFWT